MGIDTRGDDGMGGGGSGVEWETGGDVGMELKNIASAFCNVFLRLFGFLLAACNWSFFFYIYILFLGHLAPSSSLLFSSRLCALFMGGGVGCG